MNRSVYAIATMDTKGEEIAYVASCLRRAGVQVKTVDVGTFQPPTIDPDIRREEVLAGRPLKPGGDRGAAVSAMSEALADYLDHQCEAGSVTGVIGIGGSGGTAIVTAAMRRLPIGLPKLMVSTVASGNVSQYVDCSDLTMMYSVVDVAGLNSVSARVLGNAAHAMAGMVSHELNLREPKPTLGMTMFGVTTPCVDAVRKSLSAAGYDCLVFHATGSGGRAMEKLVASGLIEGVLDISTTEVADQVVGGTFPSGPSRFEAMIEAKIPLVLSVGALDMVNFGSLESVPEKFKSRNLHVHNAQVTLMRTTAEECRQIAVWIAGKLNRATAPWSLLIPERGVSMLDAAGAPFFDPLADEALFDELEKQIEASESRAIVRLPYHINDPPFAEALVDHFLKLRERKEPSDG